MPPVTRWEELWNVVRQGPRDGRIEDLRSLLARDPDCIRKWRDQQFHDNGGDDDYDGRMPLLSMAIENGVHDPNFIRLLLQANPMALQQASYDYGYLPVHVAIRRRAPLPIVQVLVEAWPPSLLRGDGAHKLALHHVASRSRPLMDVAQFLIEACPSAMYKKDDHGQLPVHWAACRNARTSPELIRYLIDRWPGSIRVKTSNGGGGLLHLAVASEDPSVDVIQWLVEQWPPSIQERSGRGGYTPLHCAVSASTLHEPVVRYLLDLWPDAAKVKSMDDGSLPLHVAIPYHHESSASMSVMQMLVNTWPGSVRVANQRGLLPLHIAVTRAATTTDPESSVVQYLVDQWPESIRATCRLHHRLPLHYACMNSTTSKEVIRWLVEAYPGAVQHLDASGLLPLHHLFQMRHYRPGMEKVRCLVEAWPASLQVHTPEGRIPLHDAISNNATLDILQCLVEHGGPETLRVPDRDGYTAFMLALRHLNCAECQFLLDQWPGAASQRSNDGRFPLHMAAARYSDALEMSLLQRLVELCPEAVRDTSNERAALPLHSAIRSSRMGTAEYLLEMWRDAARVPAGSGELPLHMAIREGVPAPMIHGLVDLWPESVRVAATDDGMLPIHYALKVGARPETVTHLLEAWPESIRSAAADGMLPIHIAASNCWNSDIVRLLLEKDPALVRQRSRGGWLPLHYASGRMYGKAEQVRHMVELFPESLRERTTDAAGWLPLHCATRFRAPLEVVRCLVDLWPESVRELTRGDGCTALHYAVRFNAPYGVLRFLVEQWPRSVGERSTGDGLLALHYAVKLGAHRDTVEFLVEKWPGSVRERSGSDGLLALHYGVRMSTKVVPYLVEQWPDSVHERTADGMLPLHEAIRLQAPKNLIFFLAERWPESVREQVPNEFSLPLHDAIRVGPSENLKGKASWCSGVLCHLVELWPESVREPMVTDSEGMLLPLHAAIKFRQAPLDVVMSMVEAWPASVQERSSYEGFLPIDYAVRFEAPPEVVLYLVEQWPESVRERAPDDASGRRLLLLPLHAAIQYQAPSDVVLFLLEMWHGSVHERTRIVGEINDAEGMLPIHLALQSKASSHVVLRLVELWPDSAREPATIGDNGASRYPIHMAVTDAELDAEVILCLARHWVGGLQVPDTNGLLPVQAVAAAALNENVRESNVVPSPMLDLIFELAVLCPQSLVPRPNTNANDT